MSSKGDFGDYVDNSCLSKGSNHVFDEMGENIRHHSDNESNGSRSGKSRFINPAIFVEPVESSQSVTSLEGSVCDEVQLSTPHPHGTYRSSSTPMLTERSPSSSSIIRKSCKLLDTDLGQEDEEDTARFRTYREEGQETFRLSVRSVSTTTTAVEERERDELRRKEAFRQWLAKKEQEKREKARLEKTKRPKPQPMTTPEQREESYRRWLERKKAQAEQRRNEEMMRRYRENEMSKEHQKNFRDKEEKLTEWYRKKQEAIKVMKTKEEREAARKALEQERRKKQGEQAYKDWLRTSKNKPLPVPLNQGELSMRGSVSEMYINPIPWQSPA